MFRLEPYFGRFPEGKDAKEKVIKAQYGKPLKPGCKCSLMHVLTTTYLGKSEQRGDSPARLIVEKTRGQEIRLPDMTITVVSTEAWKDAGITDGSQVIINVFEEGHRFQMSGDEAGNVKFIFSPREFPPLFIHCFLFWDQSNQKSAKYGFVCQLKTNSSMYLAARPNAENSARLSLVSDSQGDMLPEFWGEIGVDLCSNKDDGNSYWVVEKESGKLDGGILCGGEAFVLKHLFVRKYLGADFRLVPRARAQVFTFPFSGSHSPEETLKRLRAKKDAEEEDEDIVEMFERYPLLRLTETEEGTLVGCINKPTKEHLWSTLMLPFAWTLRPGLHVRQELTYLIDSTPDSLLRFEVREADTRSAFQVFRVSGKIASFVRLHLQFESNPFPEEERSLSRRDISPQISMRTSNIRMETDHDEDPANTSVIKVQSSDSVRTFLASLEGNSQLSEIPKLLSVMGVHRRELDLMIDAQLFTEALRFIFLLLTSTALEPYEREELAKHVSFLFPNQKLVWSSLHANKHLLRFLAEKHLEELTSVLVSAREHLQPLKEDAVLLVTLVKVIEPKTKEIDGLVEALDPDALMKLSEKPMSLTELMTRKVFKISKSTNFAKFLSRSTQKERELRDNIETWGDWINQIDKMSQAAKKAEKVVAMLERMQLPGGALVHVMKGVLSMFKQLVNYKVQQESLQMKNDLLEDSEEVKPFVQAAFRLVMTYHHWVNHQVTEAYHHKIVNSTEDVIKYIEDNLSLSALIQKDAKEAEAKEPRESGGIQSIILAGMKKEEQRQSDGSFMTKAQEGLLNNSRDPLSLSSIDPVALQSSDQPAAVSEPLPDIGLLLTTIAKKTRFRVKDKPDQLLKMIDTALNPARSAVKVIDKLLLKETFSDLVDPIGEVMNSRNFCACVKEGQVKIVPEENFEEYVDRLDTLRRQLSSVFWDRESEEVIKCLQQLLAASGFGDELKRMWSYCAILSHISEGVAARLRSCTFELSMFYVVNNFKHTKAVFQMLSPDTFCVDYPEYIHLLKEMNAIPRNDEVVKDLLSLIDTISKSDRAKAARTELAVFANLTQFEQRDSEMLEYTSQSLVPSSMISLKQEVHSLMEKRKHFPFPNKAISLLFDQVELYKEDLYEKMMKDNQFFNLLNSIGGGALKRMSIFSLGLNPYITSSIILQVLTQAIPEWKKEQKEGGEYARRQTNKRTRLLSLILCVVQSQALLQAISNFF